MLSFAQCDKCFKGFYIAFWVFKLFERGSIYTIALACILWYDVYKLHLGPYTCV